MEIQYYGGNCVKIATKKATLTIDDNLAEIGLKNVTKDGDIALFSNSEHGKIDTKTKMFIDQPGEYEVSEVSLQGIAARSHMDEAGKKSAIIFKIIADDMRIAAVGHIYPDLSDAQLEAIGTVDVLIVPVGGNGYTLDPVGALKLIKKIEPKIIIPTHYGDKAIKYPVPQQTLEEVLKGLAMEPKETLPKLKAKPSELLSDATQLIILEKQ